MLCTIFAAYIPVLQKEMFDSLGGGKLSQIPVIIVLFVVLQMLSGVCTYFACYIHGKAPFNLRQY